MKQHHVKGRRRLSALAALLMAAAASAGLQVLTAAAAPAAAVQNAAIPFSAAEATSLDGRTFTLDWTAPAGSGVTSVYARTSASAEGPGRSVGRAGPHGHLVVSGLPAADRWYFELRPAAGAPLVIAERSLHLPTAPNFRDVGGYRTRDGRWVKMGLAYRSDELDLLSDADLARVEGLTPGLVVDLRTASERQKGPDRTPAGATPMVADVLADAPAATAAIGQIKAPEDAANLLVKVNRQFISLPSAGDAYQRLFAGLGSASTVTVYHCTAGKDRTGWASAVLLTALGVPRATVMADYLLSNTYLAEKNRAQLSKLPAATAANLEPAFTVRPAYLDAAFAEVDRRYGSFDRYLKNGLGLDQAALDRLRSRFLAGAAAR
jgi:protein-tyrosine phosphatase